MIRLAFCLDNFQIGGTELNAVRWAEHLARSFELTVVHFQADGPLRARFEQTGARLVHLPLRNMYGPGAMLQGIRLARLLARRGVQVFQAHDIYSNVFGVPWARMGGVPAVVASRRWWHPLPLRAQQFANRVAYRAAHRVLANSPSVATLLERDEGVRRSKIVCMPNCLPEDAFRPLSRAERAAWRAQLGVPVDAFVIGIVARLDKLKDHATLLRAFARLSADGAAPHVHLLCIGDGPERTDLAKQARALQLDGRVTFAGTLTPSFNLHALFEVSVLCSVTEGFPNAVLEAMAAARPVVATRVGGVPDVVWDGARATGVLVPAGDADALAGALRDLIAAPEGAGALGLEAQAHVRATYHERIVLGRLTAWYESLVQDSARGTL